MMQHYTTRATLSWPHYQLISPLSLSYRTETLYKAQRNGRRYIQKNNNDHWLHTASEC